MRRVRTFVPGIKDRYPTQEELRRFFLYDQITGHFLRRSDGKRMDHPDRVDSRYTRRRVSVSGKWFKAHRLVFIWMTGAHPEEVDHIDGNPSNNAWENLRSATRLQNCANIKARGYFYHKEKNRYRVNVKVDGKLHFIGNFKSPDEARAAYEAACIRLKGEFARAA